MSNYPPGVSGNEYEIAGPDHEEEIGGPCPLCGEESLLEQGYHGSRWVICTLCEYTSDSDPEYDPMDDSDDMRDAREDR